MLSCRSLISYICLLTALFEFEVPEIYHVFRSIVRECAYSWIDYHIGKVPSKRKHMRAIT